METLYFIAGFLLILTGLIDLYFSILHYEGYRAIGRTLQKGIWYSFRSISSLFPPSIRSYTLSQGAPIMIICTLLFWIGIEITGFSLVYYAGMNSRNFLFLTKNSTDLQDAFYFSSVTLPTLGFGDVVPISTFFRITAAIESLIGFAIMTLSLSFILNIYRVIQQFRTLASSIYHQISPGNDVWMIIKRHWHNSNFEPDSAYFRDLHHRLLEWFENLHQFPIAYYFYSPRAFLSIPYCFQIIGELLTALRFGFPLSHPSNSNPDILSLTEAYISICKEILKMYHSPSKVNSQFIGNNDHDLSDTFKMTQRKRFNLLSQKLSTLEHVPFEAPESKELRFVQWLHFSSFIDQFVHITAKDHGYAISNFNSL